MSDTTSPPLRGKFEVSNAQLRQHIGLWGLIALAVSVQVGSGWILATLAAASIAGSASLVVLGLGAVLFGVIGMAWMELDTMLPRSGPGVRYPRLTHGALLSWFNGCDYLIAVLFLPVIRTQV